MKYLKCLKVAVAALLVAVILLSTASCSIDIKATELSQGYERTATETGEVSEEFKAAMADFSFSLFKGIITKDGKNDLVSPLSAILCLAMIANGADGETLREIEETFGMDIPTLNKCLFAYISSLYGSNDCKIRIADSIWFRDDEGKLVVNKEFLQTNADWYGAEIYASPFDDTTVKDINNWCKKQTDGMIDEIIKEIDANNLMYLINTLTFDAKWQEKYEKKQIRDGQFKNYGGTKAAVTMLSSEEDTYISGDGVVGFSKNYMGRKYSFTALLPSEETDIYDYAASLDGESWLSLWESRESATVDVKIPEFTYNSSMRLNDTLKALGMEKMFDAGADFSKLGSSPDGIYCSRVQQDVFIEVNRNGTKAAAITFGEMDGAAAEPRFVTLDRPFVYMIVDNATGLPLFVGVVTNL